MQTQRTDCRQAWPVSQDRVTPGPLQTVLVSGPFPRTCVLRLWPPGSFLVVTWGSPGIGPVFVEFSTFVGLLGNHWFAIQISPFTSEPFLHEVKLITCFAVTKGFSAHLVIYPHSHTTIVKIRRVHITCAWHPPDCEGGELATQMPGVQTPSVGDLCSLP